jgi:hypothetical protein
VPVRASRPRKGWNEEERIRKMRDDDGPGPLTPASASGADETWT